MRVRAGDGAGVRAGAGHQLEPLLLVLPHEEGVDGLLGAHQLVDLQHEHAQLRVDP